jgi:peptidoglycan hydrolase CwlO-like protein
MLKCDIFNVYSSKTKTTKMSTKTAKNQFMTLLAHRTGRISLAVVASVLITLGAIVPGVRADQYDVQIQALRDQNATAQSNVDSLQAQADSYQDAVSKLQAQIDALQAQISANIAQQVQLQQQITEKQAEIDRERGLLGEDIKAMYVDGDMTTVEMLATSKSLSEYVDKEEYRNLVQQNIQDELVKIAQLQNTLKQQKTQVDQLLQDQQTQQSQLAADRSQQADMLAYTEAQKNQYNSQISANSSQIAELRRQQIIANSRYTIGPAGTGVNCGGGYPGKWCEIGQDTVIDNWGMYNRECVSYTAYKVHMDFLAGRTSHDMPYWGGSGNANQWDDNARAAGISVDSNPTPGSIAISNAGTYGHAMYVEQVGTVSGQQAVYVSQYNQQLNGQYSEQWRYTTGLVFIHF